MSEQGTEKEICCKVHIHGNRRVVAACDRDILGKEFNEDPRKIFVDPVFYFQKMIQKDELLNLIETADIVNLVGNISVGIAIDASFVHPDHVIVIEGIKHAQIMAF